MKSCDTLIQIGTRVNKMVLYSLPRKWLLQNKLSLLLCIQNTNETVRDAPELLKSRSAVLNPSVQQARTGRIFYFYFWMRFENLVAKTTTCNERVVSNPVANT